MKLHLLIMLILVFIILPSLSYGDESKVRDKKMTFTDKIAQQLQDTSDKLKAKYKNLIITEQEAIRIAKEYRQHKEYEVIDDWEHKISTEYFKSENYEYSYAIDWEHPHTRLGRMALKKDGSLSSGLGKKVLVWHVWFLPLDGIDLEGKRNSVGVDIDAKTGEVFTKYSLSKI